MAASGQVFIGVDVGGTKIGVNGVDETRKPLSPAWAQVPSQSDIGPRATVGQIVVGLQMFLKQIDIPIGRVAALGLDSPGPADLDGRIQRSANMHPDWEGFLLRAEVEKALAAAVGESIPVTYENDCNAAALWESFSGNPQGTEVMALLAPGTGLGGGIVINGRLLRGARGMGGELGHVEIVHSPFVPGVELAPCGCGQRYCAETYASLAGLVRALPGALALPKYEDHPLQQITGDNLWRKRAYQVRTMAAAGDELCLALFDWQSQALGRLCRQIADTIDPHRIVIGGGFIEGGQALTARVMQNIRTTFQQLAFKKHAAEVRFEPASSGDQAGCLGAALSAWQVASGT